MGLGGATVEFEASNRHAKSVGTSHGGLLCHITGAAMGIAYSVLADGNTFTTIELKINFFWPVSALSRSQSADNNVSLTRFFDRGVQQPDEQETANRGIS
jgi:hypothetical protein